MAVVKQLKQKIDTENNFTTYEIGAEATNVSTTTGDSVEDRLLDLDSNTINVLGADRLAFFDPTLVSIQYSTDKGNSWSTYTTEEADVAWLFTPVQDYSTLTNFYMGKVSTGSSQTANMRLLVTVNNENQQGTYLKSDLNKFAIYGFTAGSSGCWCNIEGKKKGASSYTTIKSAAITDGWTVIKTSNISIGTGTDDYTVLRFRFGHSGQTDTSQSGFYISNIQAFGGIGEVTPSNMAATGNLYSYDEEQNVTFPGTITATGTTESSEYGFIGNLDGIAKNAETANYATSAASATTATTANTATTATTLKTARYIDGVLFNGSADIIHFGTCSTAGSGSAKVVDCAGFKLTTGARIVVQFTDTSNTTSNSNITLNVNSTGAKSLRAGGYYNVVNLGGYDHTYEFIYDGTYYQLIGGCQTQVSVAGTTLTIDTRY